MRAWGCIDLAKESKEHRKHGPHRTLALSRHGVQQGTPVGKSAWGEVDRWKMLENSPSYCRKLMEFDGSLEQVKLDFFSDKLVRVETMKPAVLTLRPTPVAPTLGNPLLFGSPASIPWAAKVTAVGCFTDLLMFFSHKNCFQQFDFTFPPILDTISQTIEYNCYSITEL